MTLPASAALRAKGQRSYGPPAVRTISELSIPARGREEALADIADAVRNERTLCVAFVNTHLAYHAHQNVGLSRALNSFYLLNDGVGLSFLSFVRNGGGFCENLNGTDFTPALLQVLPNGTRLYMVGAQPDVVKKAATHIAGTYDNIEICGTCDGYSANGEARKAVFSDIKRQKPNLILVAMGNPLQEEWIAEAARVAPGSVMLGVGALFDYLSGAKTRAPPSWRSLRLEWMFRLAREPHRLAKRYTVEFGALLMDNIYARFVERPN